MTTMHLTPDEFATYLIGEAIRRKIAAGPIDFCHGMRITKAILGKGD